ncbi:phosphotransferase family protein [Novosphingobium sp. FKTRR1]|uniref:phosphotransferase family protein n=1 Tax=Novosphingobium sp. FKTRR1 TaxID=2879118 RepID=UPI001CF093D3|nr:phosphotransferase family protein [Novosphingobium sp. FKTRR1]
MNAVAGLADTAKLTSWLDAHVPELGAGPLAVTQLHGGTSNVILMLNRGDMDMVLRRPPPIAPPGAEKGVLREARVLTALRSTSVPHPRCWGACADPEVIGAPFYVMDRVEGWAAELRDERIYHRAPFDRAPCEYGIGYAMVDGLIALANVDYKAVGLEGFGKPGNFLERQVDRWEGQIRSYPERYGSAWRELPGFAYARDWLRANVPDDFRAGIIHGDVGTPNALFAFDRPARLTALIDWELSTIGDPLIDLAWFTGRLRDEDHPDVIGEATLYAVENFPTRQELARYYAAGTGRDLACFDYYCVLAAYKSGCILEYKVAQSSAGILPPEAGRFFDKLVHAAFARAETLARKAG